MPFELSIIFRAREHCIEAIDEYEKKLKEIEEAEKAKADAEEANEEDELNLDDIDEGIFLLI